LSGSEFKVAAQHLICLEHLRRGLERLTVDQRTVVMLARLGCSHQEIAAQLGIRVGRVRKLLRRGYLTLKMSALSGEH
jgi:DNA-directed RNA polymerase specialized sigma24 family protein